MEAQTSALLCRLGEVLATAGTSFDRVLRVEVFLATAEDFQEFKNVYAKFFPDDPPARTTVVIGDEHLVDGCRVSLHAVALAGDATTAIVTVNPETLPNPISAEHASYAKRAGPFVFCSGFPATDHSGGLAVKAPENTYHGSNARLQANYVIKVLGSVLKDAGSSLELGLKVQFYEPDLSTFPEVDAEWGRSVGVPPARSSMACRGLTVPGTVFAPNLWALAADSGFEKIETREGIPWHPIDLGKANFSPGLRAGGWLFTSGQIPVPDLTTGESISAPAGLPHHWSDIEIQTAFTLGLLAQQLKANSFSLDEVVEARVYLVNPRRDFRGFTRAWEAFFADSRELPALSVIASTQADGSDGVMVKGPTIEVEFTCFKIGA